MIPKIIHFIWLGKNKKSDLIEKCIKSWRQYCPDYEIKEWNDDNTLNINNTFFREAVEHEKWAFASDYLRLYVLSKFGGFYCDTDLEITQSLDIFLKKDFVIGFELYKNRVHPAAALIGSIPQQKIILDCLSYYSNRHFVLNGKLDMKTNTKIISEYFEDKYAINLSKLNGEDAVFLSESEIIYPYYYFCIPKLNKENYSIHHFTYSWIENYKRRNIFSIGKLHLLRFRKQKEDNLPPNLLKGEKLLFGFSYQKGNRLIWLTWH